MKNVLILIASMVVLAGCSSLQKSLEKAAKVATGPCGQKVAEAIAVCNVEQAK